MLILIPFARGASESALRALEHRQVQTLHRYEGTVRFFANHWRLGWTPAGRRAVRVAFVWIAVVERELRETRTALRPPTPWPSWWATQAACIRWQESRGIWTTATGNGYWGAYQFLIGTWTSVGGKGLPSAATPFEQTYRAWLVWKRDGGSWREWGTARACGVD